VIEKYGGDDETRTRDLCRDSVAWIGFTTTCKTRGDCQTTHKSYKTSHFVGWVVGWKKAVFLNKWGGLALLRRRERREFSRIVNRSELDY